MVSAEQETITRYFTLESAVRLLPFVKTTLRDAYRELSQKRNDIVLYKRLLQVREREFAHLEADPSRQSMADLLHQKWHDYEDCFHRWVQVLTDEGIQVRDFRKGLVDFPYLAQDGSEYCLCWHWGEDGLFYFHDTEEGFAGRKPITLLPD